MYALLEKGPSAQKYGVSPAARRRNAEQYYAAAKLIKDGGQAKLMTALAMAVEDGEAKMAIELYGRLSAKSRQALK